ncbi:type I secretion C-terminal target domain-containing protein [Pseudomonas capeferrum]|nr:type I secretion C-terminal target domain-containing protein [Pseudomonas capeferrum]
MTFTLEGGGLVTIEAGKASGTYVLTTADDVYVGGQPVINKSITGITGGNVFEKLSTSGYTCTTVTDETGTPNNPGTPGTPNGGDQVIVSIVSNGNVTEAQQPSFTVKVNQVLDRDLTVTLSNGDKVLIAAGKTEATYRADAQGDDVFKDAGSLTVGISDATVVGKSFENLQLGDAATVQISDTISEVVATLTADKASVTEGGQITYTVNLANAQGLPAAGHGGLSFTLTDGTVVKVAAGSTSGTATITVKDDAYIGGQADIVNKLVSVSGGENFEKLTLGSETRTTSVTDEPSGQGDLTTVGITGDSSVTEGATAHYTLTLSNPAKSEVTVTLSYSGTATNGQDYTGVTTVKIPANASSASFDIKTINDQLVEGSENFVIKISGATGGNFENLQVDSSKSAVTTTIIDNDHAPVSTGGAVTGTEDTDYFFTWNNFKVTDADGNSGLSVTISKLPVLGSLKFYSGTTWVDVSLNQTVSQADIDKGYLKFVPVPNQSGIDGYGGIGVGNQLADYAQMKFKPNDGTNAGIEVTMKIDIAPVADKPSLSVGSSNVDSLGLTKETWTSLTGLGNNGNGITGEALKTVFANSGNASRSETTTNVQSDSSVTAQTGSKISGLIYLEAGKTYTFSGVGDDSLYVTIGGKSVATATWGAGGAISGSFTPTASGYFPIEVYHANQSGPGSYDLNIKVGNGAVTDLSSANIPMYQNVTEMANAGLTPSDLHTVNGQSYYDGYKLNEGPEGGSVKLVGITTALTDTDGSESLSVTLSGLPRGAVVSDGAGHSVTVEGTPIDVTNWKLSGLTITPPAYYKGSFDITVTSTATESLGGSASTTAKIPVTVYGATYQSVIGTSNDDQMSGGESNDIMVGDVAGLNVIQGKNYNIAFMVDSSGSMSHESVAAAKAQLASVFQTLKDSLGSDTAGTVNIFLADFDTQVNETVSVNLADTQALSKLQTVLDSMVGGSYYGGGTNYEDVFKTTANFFKSSMATNNTDAIKLTYFITDGKPTYYQTGEQTNPRLWNYGPTLDSVVNTSNYKLGDTFSVWADSTHRIDINSSGVVKVTTISWWSTTETLGTIHAQGDGTYELSKLAGNGTSDFNNYYYAANGSTESFALLSGLSKVQAIGLNSDVTLNDLKPYDSEGKPQTNIDPSKLANAILGHTEATLPGADTLDGGNGNDILFGDLITLNGVDSEGYQALQTYVAKQAGVDASTVTTSNVHQYISEHYSEFDISGANDGNDILNGGNGNDILFGQGGDDKLYGGKGNDILLGGKGTDLLDGGDGDDILIGGKGNDTMTGGSGADLFVWKAGDIGKDVIKDFKASEGDRLDLSDLLQHETTSTIDNFLKITTANGESTLQVSSEGKLNATGGLANADVTIKLEGVNWSNTTINSLISGADPTIKIDHNN